MIAGARMRPVHINGKFYAGGLNGVHRVADRLIREFDTLLSQHPECGLAPPKLHLPERRQWEPALKVTQLVYETDGHTQRWEQTRLPARAKGGVLINLCNLGPILHPRKLIMVHDAQFLFPDSSYPARLRWGYRLLTPLMARSSLQVLTVSDYSRQMLELFGVSERAHTRVIHNGADHITESAADGEAVGRLNLTGRRYAVHIASPKAYKNSQVVFDAFAQPELADCALVLIGPGQADLERAGLTPPPDAIHAGKVNDGELRALYESAACLLYPSRTEGFGLPPVEAMTCGCAAVVAPAGAIPEICRDAAIYADVDDPSAWVGAIRQLLDDDEHRTQKVRQGERRAADFTWASAGRALFDTVLAAADD